MSRRLCHQTRLAALLAMGLVALLSLDALAYVRTTTPEGHPIAWKRSCVFLTPDFAGSPDVGAQATHRVIAAAAESWNSAAWSCDSPFQFVVQEPKEDLKRGFTTKGTNKNVVVWLEDHWGDGEVDYDPNAVALTTITFIADPGAEDDGEILDADVEFNGVNGRFFVTPPGDPGAHDIQNTLTHELGHVLGLDHPCYDGAVDPRPIDHQGNPIPDCQPRWELPPELLALTMYNFTDPGETNKRSLEADDVAGICGIYPQTDQPGPCEPVSFSPGGCSCATATARAKEAGALLPLILFLFGVLGLYSSRRRP
jgi:hypothetical protein